MKIIKKNKILEGFEQVKKKYKNQANNKETRQ